MIDNDIEAEIGALAGLDLFALRERWKAFCGSEAPVRMSRELILRAVAYRMQAQAFGGLSRAHPNWRDHVRQRARRWRGRGVSQVDVPLEAKTR